MLCVPFLELPHHVIEALSIGGIEPNDSWLVELLKSFMFERCLDTWVHGGNHGVFFEALQTRRADSPVDVHGVFLVDEVGPNLNAS
jgi:hypothetical protein